jgi:hypothetical protein
MKLVETAPFDCICGRRQGPLLEIPFVNLTVPVPAGMAKMYLCSECLCDVFALVAAIPLAVHQQTVDHFNEDARAAHVRIGELEADREELLAAREQIEAWRPQIEQQQAVEQNLRAEIAAEQKRREEAEELADGIVGVRAFRRVVEEAIAAAHENSKPRKRQKVAA